MKTVTGDLIQLAKKGHFNLIVHGCNCFCAMGAGIAAAIRKQFPEAYAADLATKEGDRQKLGSFSYAQIDDLVVVNAYTQFGYDPNVPQLDYDALRHVFVKIARTFPDRRIAYPKIGAGLAGGDWLRISPIIEEALQGLDHTLVLFSE